MNEEPLDLRALADVDEPDVLREALRTFRRRVLTRYVWITVGIGLAIAAAVWGLQPSTLSERMDASSPTYQVQTHGRPGRVPNSLPIVSPRSTTRARGCRHRIPTIGRAFGLDEFCVVLVGDLRVLGGDLRVQRLGDFQIPESSGVAGENDEMHANERPGPFGPCHPPRLALVELSWLGLGRGGRDHPRRLRDGCCRKPDCAPFPRFLDRLSAARRDPGGGRCGGIVVGSRVHRSPGLVAFLGQQAIAVGLITWDFLSVEGGESSSMDDRVTRIVIGWLFTLLLALPATIAARMTWRRRPRALRAPAS